MTRRIWIGIKIPKPLFDRITNVIGFLGFGSVSEYVRARVEKGLGLDELRAEEFRAHLEELKEAKV